MMGTTTGVEVVHLIGGLFLFIISAGIVGLLKIGSDLRKEFRLLNGRMIGMESWRSGHEQRVTETQQRNVERFRDLESKD
jgi:hypothetical protein